MRTWSKTTFNIEVLVEAHYNNNPYFPRARPSDPLYISFKKGYMSAHADHPDSEAVAQAFLDAIEVEQAEWDDASSTGRLDEDLPSGVESLIFGCERQYSSTKCS